MITQPLAQQLQDTSSTYGFVEFYVLDLTRLGGGIHRFTHPCARPGGQSLRRHHGRRRVDPSRVPWPQSHRLVEPLEALCLQILEVPTMNVYLISTLGEKFGSEPMEMHVASPVQMFRGLECNVEGWEAEMRSLASAEEKLCVVVGNGKEDGYRNVNPNFLTTPFDKDITDVYVVASINGGGIEIGAFTFMGLQGYAAVAAYVVFNIAVGMAVGAITQALSASPDTSSGNDKPEERGSFIFNGPVNTTVQGAPVPLVYGECLTGSVVMSAGIYVEEVIV